MPSPSPPDIVASGFPIRRSLRRNVGVIFAGNAFAAALQWLVLVAIAKLGTNELVGAYAYALAVAAPIAAFASLQLRAIQAADQSERYKFADYAVARVITSAAAAIVIVGYAYSIQGQWQLVMCIVGLARCVDLVSDVFYGRWQQLESMGRASIAVVLNGAGTLSLVTLALAGTRSLQLAAVGSFAASCATLAYIAYASRSVVSLRGASLRRVLALMREALPLGFVILLIALQQSVPRYFIRAYLGDAALGSFAAVAQLPAAASPLLAALGAAATPRLAAYYLNREHAHFRRLVLRMIGLAAAMGGGGFLLAAIAGKPILAILYRPEYALLQPLLLWICAAAVFSFIGSFLGYAMTASGQIAPQPLIFSFVVGATAAICAYAIPRLGSSSGAAIAMLVASAIQCAFSVWLVYRALTRSSTLAAEAV